MIYKIFRKRKRHNKCERETFQKVEAGFMDDTALKKLPSPVAEASYYDISTADIGFSDAGTTYEKPRVGMEPVNGMEQEQITINTSSFNKPIKKYLLIGACTLSVIILSIIVLLLSKKTEPTGTVLTSEEALEIIIDHDNNGTYVINTQGDMVHTINEATRPIWYSEDYSRAYLYNDKQELYYISKDLSVHIAETIDSFEISQDGRLIYSCKMNGLISLNLYDPASNKTKVIESNENLIYLNAYISPDGRTIGYTKIPSGVNFCEAFVMVNDSQPKSLGDNTMVLKVSNEGKYVYYFRQDLQTENFELYCYRDGTAKLLSTNLPEYILPNMPNRIFFNKNYSEIMFSEDSGTYISVKGREKIKISDHQVTDVIEADFFAMERSVVNICNIDSFYNKVMTFDDSALRYIRISGDSELLASLSMNYQPRVSDSGKNLICMNAPDELLLFTNLQGDRMKHIITGVAYDCAYSKDMTEIYYSNNRRIEEMNSYIIVGGENPDISTYELYYMNTELKSGPLKVGSNVVSMLIHPMEDTLYYVTYTQGGRYSLYSYNSAEGAKAVIGLQDYDEISLIKGNHSIVVKACKNDKIYYFYNTAKDEFKHFLTVLGEKVENQRFEVIFD